MAYIACNSVDQLGCLDLDLLAMRFYKVEEWSDVSELMTTWFTCKAKAKKYCNELNRDVLKEKGTPNWTEELLHEVTPVDIPTNKKQLLKWLNTYHN